MKKLFVFATLAFALSACKENGDQNVSNGLEFYENEQYNEAISEYRLTFDKYLRQYDKEDVYTYMGLAFEETEQYDSSIYYHNKALEINPEYVDALVNLGIVYRLTEQYDLAEECYMKALKLAPFNANLLTSLGVLYISQGSPDVAMPYLEQAIEIEPEMAISHANYAVALALLNRFEDAEKETKLAEELGYKNIDNLKENISELKEQAEYDDLMENEFIE